MVWKRISSTIKYQNRYMSVTDDEIVTDHGDKLTFGVVHKDPAVWIIPWDGHKTTLVCQYRYPVDYLSWEFPAGHAESHDPITAAKLELKEETGISAKKLELIAKFFLAPGHHTQVGYVYLATELTKGEQELELAEKDMKVKDVTIAELEHMIFDGTIKDGPTITGYTYLKKHLGL